MSRTKPTDLEKAQLMFGCAYCGATAEVWCDRGSVAFAKTLHDSRWRQINMVHRLTGREAALREAWDRNGKLINQLRVWRQHIYGDTTSRYDSTYLTSRIDALLEQS